MRVWTLATLAATLVAASPAPAPQATSLPPRPTTPRPDSDNCLQRLFLQSLRCPDVDPSFNNETLPAAGWWCCWHQGPFLPPPAEAYSAWLTIGENGDVEGRCIAQGTCTEYWQYPIEGSA